MKLCAPKYRMSSRMVASSSESETKASGRSATVPRGGTGLAEAQATKTDPSASETANRMRFMGLLLEVALSFTCHQGWNRLSHELTAPRVELDVGPRGAPAGGAAARARTCGTLASVR